MAVSDDFELRGTGKVLTPLLRPVVNPASVRPARVVIPVYGDTAGVGDACLQTSPW